MSEQYRIKALRFAIMMALEMSPQWEYHDLLSEVEKSQKVSNAEMAEAIKQLREEGHIFIKDRAIYLEDD